MNTSQCTIGLLAVDSIAPQISCPDGGDFNINTDCLAELNLGVPEVNDYCSDVDFILIEGPEINGSFEVGEYESVFQAEDAFGNTATCNVVFSVFDVTAPEINCVPPTEISLDANCEIEAINMSPEAFDSCSETSWIQTSGPEPGEWIGAGIYDLLFTASDASGNQAECSTQLTVVDVSAPVIVCPPNQQLNALEDLCGTYLEYELEVSDNCSYNVDQLDGELSGAFLTLGNHSFAFEVSDPSGNTSTCSFQVEVIDNTPPLIDCVETIYISHPSETISLPQATDACGLVEVSAVGIWPPNYPLVSGNTSFEFIAVDDAGNLSTCLTSVQVNSAPIARTDRVNSFRRTETIHVLNNDEDPDGPYVLLNPGEYPDYVQQNIDDSFTLYLEDLDCVADTFTYQIRDIDGLTATGMVIIQPTCPYSIELPQIITPNGDGMNDLFVIDNLENFQENELQVFNETGQRVYHKYNYQNSWDGRGEGIGSFGSGRLPQGTYYVILHLASQERPIKGALTIVY